MEIDKMLVGGWAYRDVADQFSLSPNALFRHRRGHLLKLLVKAKGIVEATQADALLNRLEAITRRTEKVLDRAEQQKNGPLALKAITRLEVQLELQARILGEIRDRAVNVQNITVIDPQTAEAMARMYLLRRRLPDSSDPPIDAVATVESTNE
jgi:hypothetical protein